MATPRDNRPLEVLLSSPFLLRFSHQVVERLLQAQQLEVAPGREDAVVRFVAAALGGARQGSSLISTMSRALVACPDVEELFVDDEGLKGIVDSLGRTG